VIVLAGGALDAADARELGEQVAGQPAQGAGAQSAAAVGRADAQVEQGRVVGQVQKPDQAGLGAGIGDDPEGPGLVVVVVPGCRVLADLGGVRRAGPVVGPVLGGKELCEQVCPGRDEPPVADAITCFRPAARTAERGGWRKVRGDKPRVVRDCSVKSVQDRRVHTRPDPGAHP
jgi:hypothetical protein